MSSFHKIIGYEQNSHLFFFSLCNSFLRTTAAGSAGEWIKGSEEEQLRTIEKHFRGFDMAMVETGYRYQELYWAGQDENWGYADYQAGKIKVAIENGLERRPKRAASSAEFLENGLPKMQQAIQSRDTAVFNSSFRTFTIHCNA